MNGLGFEGWGGWERALCRQGPRLLKGEASKGGRGFHRARNGSVFIAYCFSAGGFSMAMLRIAAAQHWRLEGLILANLDSACV